jgi:hypothetical protein
LPENNDRLANKAAKLVRRSSVKMLLGVHEIDEQIDASLVQSHSCLL